MLTRIRQWLAPPIFEDDEDKTRVAVLLNIISLALLALVLVVGINALIVEPRVAGPDLGMFFPIGPLIVMPLLFGIVQFLMRRGHVRPAALLLVSVFWLLATAMSIVSRQGGGIPSVSAIYILVVIIAGLLAGHWVAIAVAGWSILFGLGLLYAELGGALTVLEWAYNSILLAFSAVLLFLSSVGLNKALDRARGYAAELEDQRENLEDVVKERTSHLANRARYLEASATIARDASAVLDLQALLSRVVTLISDQLGFYHTGIFLIDPSGEWAVLEAASSVGGRRMLARRHRLRVGEVGIVGYATGRNEARVVDDVSQDAVFYDNPDLPETRSEMALPLRARGSVIGALDVQSRDLAAFTQEDVAVLQILADQVAVAIDNARLYQQVEESLEAGRRAYGELSREAWVELLRIQPNLSLVRDVGGISPTAGVRSQEATKALNEGKTISGEDGAKNLAVPIRVRGQIIGTIDAHRAESGGDWTQEQTAVLEALAAQLGDALDDARVYQAAQRRAVQERLLSDASARMRETLDVDTILKTATREMRDLLDLAEVEVRVGTSPASSSSSTAATDSVRTAGG